MHGNARVYVEGGEQRAACVTGLVQPDLPPPLWPRIYGRRLGQPVLPIGIAFSTEEAVLLAENGDILFGGDAGMQRVANGFGAAIQDHVRTAGPAGR
jgi:hypothetical protein